MRIPGPLELGQWRVAEQPIPGRAPREDASVRRHGVRRGAERNRRHAFQRRHFHSDVRRYDPIGIAGESEDVA